MVAKAIVDIPSKSVDFEFDYLISSHLKDFIRVGVRVVIPFDSRAVQGYAMDIQQQPGKDTNIDRLKAIKEIRDIRPELTPELIQLSEWLSRYHISRHISMLEAILPSTIEAKYTRVFKVIRHNNIEDGILRYFDNNGCYKYKGTQRSNHLDLLNRLLEQHLVEEETILPQHTKRKAQRAVRVVEGYNPDDILALLEKKLKRYDVYVYLLEGHHRDVFLKELKDMGFSRSSTDGLIKRGFLKKYDAEIEQDPFTNRIFEKEGKRTLTST